MSVATSFAFSINEKMPYIIAGPCMAESYGMLDETASFLLGLSNKLGFKLVFKASFDKANRSSINSYRGPGLEVAAQWFYDIKSKYGVHLLTDVHETIQVAKVEKVVDVIQIPAFLCRQTDLIIKAVQTGLAVNIKKGQFLSPQNCQPIVDKIRSVAKKAGNEDNFALTERGVSFGYGNLIVDMRSFYDLHKLGGVVIYDLTHSLQLPMAGGVSGEITGGLREYAPTLSRAAAATGYVNGFFLEVHPNLKTAKSDAATQLSFIQTEVLLEQLISVWQVSKRHTAIDREFVS